MSFLLKAFSLIAGIFIMYVFFFQGTSKVEISGDGLIRPNQMIKEDVDAIDFRNTLMVEDENVFIISNKTKLFKVPDWDHQAEFKRTESSIVKGEATAKCLIVRVKDLFVDSTGNVCSKNRINFEASSNCCFVDTPKTGIRIDISKAFKETEDDLLICYQNYMDCVQYCIKNNVLDHKVLYFKEFESISAQRRMNYCIVECKNNYVLPGIHNSSGGPEVSNCIIDFTYLQYLHSQGKFELALSSKRIDCHAACLSRGSFCSEQAHYLIKRCSLLKKQFKGHSCTEELTPNSSNHDIEINNQNIRIFNGDSVVNTGYCDQTDPSEIDSQQNLKVCTCIKRYK